MTLYYKDQLYGNKVFTKDLSTSVIDLYDYTVKDYQSSLISNYIPAISINSNKKISIRDGVLSVDGYTLNLYNLLIGDVLNFLQNTIGITCFVIDSSGYIPGYADELCNVPAIMLSNFCNYSTQTLSGDISPIELASTANIDSILQLSDLEIVDVTIYDYSTNKKIDYELTDKAIYFDASVNNSVYLTKNCSSYVVFIDTKIKQLTKGILINYGLSSSDLISAPIVLFPQAVSGSISSSSFTDPTPVHITIPNGVILGDSWIAVSNGFGTTSGIVQSTDIQNGYITTSFSATQGSTLNITATYNNTYTSTQSGYGTVNLLTSNMVSCVGAINSFRFWDNGNGNATSLTFYVDINGTQYVVPCNGSIASGQGNNPNSPDGLLTTWLSGRSEFTLTGDVWDEIIITNASTTQNLRISIWVDTADTNVWSVFDTSAQDNVPVNPTFDINIGSGKSGFQVCLAPADNTGISCAGATNNVNWNGSYHMVNSGGFGSIDATTLTVKINGTTYIPNNSNFQYWWQTTLPTLITGFGRWDVNEDNYIYYVTNNQNFNTYRIEVYNTDGVTPLFTGTQADVGNPTYSELPNRIGWQACIIGRVAA